MDGLAICREWLRESANDLRFRARSVQTSYDLLQNKTTSYANALRVHAERLSEACRVLEAEVTDYEWNQNENSKA